MILRNIVRRIAREKRNQAMKTSYVKIKGNDVVATTKIFYSLIVIPAIGTVYLIVFALLNYFTYHYSFYDTVMRTFLFTFLMPNYLYICILYSYDLVRFWQLIKVTFSFRFLNHKKQAEILKNLIKEKFYLENEILKVISHHKEELKESLSKMITNRNMEELISEEQIDQILSEIK